MIDKTLINENLNVVQAIHEGRVTEKDEAIKLYELLHKTNKAYTSLIEQNAELQKELERLNSYRVFVVNDNHDDMQVNKIAEWKYTK